MATSPDGERDTAPEAEFPENPEFYRRVLDHMPSPLLVIDGSGTIVYCNQATLALGGWGLSETPNLFEHIHPEDRDGLIREFVKITESPGARVLGSNRPWAEIYFRIIASDGSTIPVEVVGSGGLMDAHVGGIIYEMRPAYWRDLMSRVFDGLSQGASMHQLLSLIARMIAMPPLDLDAIVLQSTASDSWIVAASTSPALTETLRGSSKGLPWNSASREATFSSVHKLPDHVRDPLRQAGYQDLWHVAVESPLTATTLRLIAASPTHHVPANGPRNRLSRTKVLASAVLLRSEADVLLRHAAAFDRLTNLPNRAAFLQQVEAIDPSTERAAIHLNIDGLRRINAAHGQSAGDAMLQIIADRIQVLCDPSDVVGRVGDEDFTVLLTPSESIDLMARSVELANKLLAAIQESIVVAGRPERVGCSIGVAFAAVGIGTDHLLTWADAAMHDARQRGGGAVCRHGAALG